MLFNSQFELNAGSYCVHVQFDSHEEKEKALVLQYSGYDRIHGFVSNNRLRLSKQYGAFDYITTKEGSSFYSALLKLDEHAVLELSVSEWKGSGNIKSIDVIPLTNASSISAHTRRKAKLSERLLLENKDLELQNLKLLNAMNSLKSTLSYQLGNYLVTTPKKPLNMLKIPFRIKKIYRNFKSTKLKEDGGSSEWFDIDMLPAKIYQLNDKEELQIDIDIRVGIGEKKKAALIQFQFDSIAANAVTAKQLGMSYSEKVGLYKYLNTGTDSLNSVKIRTPDSASEVKVSTLSWYSNGKIRARLIANNHNPKLTKLGVTIKTLSQELAAADDWKQKTLSLNCDDKTKAATLYDYSADLARSQRLKVLNFFIDHYPCSTLLAKNMRQLTDFGDFELLNKALTHITAADKMTYKKQVNSAIGYLNLQKRLPVIPTLLTSNTGEKNNHSPIAFVLHCSLPFHSNGYATRSHELIKAISKNEKVTVYTRPGYPCDVLQDQSEFLSSTVDGIEYKNIGGADYYLDPLDEYIKKASEVLISQFIKDRPQAVVAASSFYNALPALIAARSLAIPFIYEVRGLWEITRASAIPDWKKSDRFKLESQLEAYVAKHADSVITITEGLKNELVNRGVDKSRISIVPNAINKEQFNFTQQKEKKKIVIGYVGSIVEYEGLDDLIFALESVYKKGKNFELIIAGDGPYLSQLTEIVKNSTISTKVRLLGRIPHEEVDQLLKTIDITPFPRKSIEVCELVSPLKPFESMLSGKVILASNVKALKEVIDGRNGLLFEKGSIKDLTAKLEELIDSVDLRKSLSEYARDWVLKNRLWSVVTEQYSTVLNSTHGSIAQEKRTTNELRVLIYGDVDINYTDGSSIWAVSTVDVFSQCEQTKVDFLLKSDNLNSLVLQQINQVDKDVKIIQPSQHGIKDRLSPSNAINLICELMQKNDYDAVILRGAEINKLALGHPELAGITWVYPVEIFQKERNEVTLEDRAILQNAVKILCQSEFIKNDLIAQFNVDKNKIIDLPPMVPDSINKYKRTSSGKTQRIVYAGKFDPLWATEEMLITFQAIREKLKHIELHVYGNKFNDKSEDKSFTKRVTQLLNRRGVIWHKGVSRDKVLSELPEYDLAWAWRSPNLDMHTHEISTKFLEYSSKGLPILCVPGKAYIANLGEDYPLYVEQESHLVDKIISVLSNKSLLNKASEMTYLSSNQFFYSTVVKQSLTPAINAILSQYKEKTCLIAGHDLKFVRKYIELSRQQGYKVNVDKWLGHNKHNELDSARKLVASDSIYCEWMLENAVWYSKNKLKHQNLTVRFHRQEIETTYPEKVIINNVNQVHFIAPLVMRDARKLFWNERAVGVLRENYIDSDALNKPKFTNAKFTLGIVGIVPKMKRIDKALDLLEALRKKDDRYTLRIKGKLPNDYHWMKSRKNEMNYFDKQFQRIEASEYLRGAVLFDGHGNDMDHWFRNIGYLLSFSDFEGCHLSAMEAMGSGAIPLISNWKGADEIYPKKYIFKDIGSICHFLKKCKSDHQVKHNMKYVKDASTRWALNPSMTIFESDNALLES
ncbi:glycosyltransferase [Shewanella surugensis]|uniref:Glycosyltransferase n=1 Tax=Shewanella surugensis TaxID=212020 RepID=A0ABT0LEP9_9GAMM|nr:glycosyltransferase [Shewanella surugensis]MCL1126187.1 glycosyltransferase [Shewanella surugensis]